MSTAELAELSERQREILARVVEGYVATSTPVGSRMLVERFGFVVSASTVRAELAELERIGLLTHPHTSAGRVPTEAGLPALRRRAARPAGAAPVRLPARARHAPRGGRGGAAGDDRGALAVDAAARARLGAADRGRDGAARRRPPAAGERDRGRRDHLHRRVSKQRYTFPDVVDAGLVVWAGDYLRERLIGLRLRSRLLARAFDEPGFSPREQAFLAVLRSSFDRLEDERELYVGGAAGLLDDLRTEEIGAYRSLIDALEKRATLLGVLAQSARAPAGSQRPSFAPRRRRARGVGAAQARARRGLATATPNQPLGTVSLLGPLRMDYEKALRTVRSAAHELSRFVEEVYTERFDRR